MFRKIVSQLSFSPVTVEQLGKYAKKTRQNQHLYGWSVVLLIALLTLQLASSAITTGPSPTTPTANDLVSGGLPSIDTVLSAYDNNTSSFKDIASLLSISRSNLTAVNLTDKCEVSDLTTYTTGRTTYQDSKNEYMQLVSGTPVYFRPITTSTSTGWCGTSDQGERFLINAADGNISFSTLPSELTKDQLVRSLTSDKRKAASGQTVTWSLTASNNSGKKTTEDIWFSTGDIAEYAHITSISDEGISTSKESHIVWPSVEIRPGEKKTLKVSAYIDHSIDTTARQSHNTQAYDCKITASFGNSTETDISCPAEKQVETLFYQSTRLEPLMTTYIITALLVLSVVAYISLRIKSREIRIIRKQLNTGGL